ncbi:hypothetical protein CC1G_15208 [Coprinopsis cinerea okayama7|uniref:Uncharacterized protein n=1 Tax=Coprinopsis cinerea (strain Okayama-7 / 130 / ATCC MYA-4618 / FGSC 9003) TaxID=240176 RepID=D6RPJ3_COPC7|nr:hypothetical protein CC1G_15208 [Coprinopsis cinerea okayama7\|eukprot:XP_002910573.1 hypothetical protein CC1G_15208 [Coprinopsis cinerea okayama7\
MDPGTYPKSQPHLLSKETSQHYKSGMDRPRGSLWNIPSEQRSMYIVKTKLLESRQALLAIPMNSAQLNTHNQGG